MRNTPSKRWRENVSDRFEASLKAHLAEIFLEKLAEVLEAEGFREGLRIAEPHVTEYHRDSELLTVQSTRVGHHKELVVVESEAVDVAPLVGMAVKNAVVGIADELFHCLPWVDRHTVRAEIETRLAELVLGSR